MRSAGLFFTEDEVVRAGLFTWFFVIADHEVALTISRFRVPFAVDEQAEAAAVRSADWVSENMADSVALEENLIGEMTTLAATERSAV